MADIKISALSQVSEVQSTDVVPVVSGNSTMKMTAAQIKNYCVGDLDVSDSAVAGSYVTAVSETDGEISVTREAADRTPIESSTKMVTSGGVYTALSSKAAQSTISNAFNASTAYATGDYFIDNNIIYHVDVPCIGITPPNANYYTANNLTDLIEANSSQISDLDSELSTLDSDKVDWTDFAELGAVNLLPNNGTTRTLNGITFTVNDDGSVTASGTASARANFNIVSSSAEINLQKGITYKLSARAILSASVFIEVNIKNTQDTSTRYVNIKSSADNVSFTIGTYEYISDIYISVLVGTDLTTPITIYPMISLANYNGNYVPYAKTNKELTDIVSCPADTNGTYTLQAVVSSGAVTYSWVASS